LSLERAPALLDAAAHRFEGERDRGQHLDELDDAVAFPIGARRQVIAGLRGSPWRGALGSPPGQWAAPSRRRAFYPGPASAPPRRSQRATTADALGARRSGAWWPRSGLGGQTRWASARHASRRTVRRGAQNPLQFAAHGGLPLAAPVSQGPPRSLAASLLARPRFGRSPGRPGDVVLPCPSPHPPEDRSRGSPHLRYVPAPGFPSHAPPCS
jgi:hypothetical protein